MDILAALALGALGWLLVGVGVARLVTAMARAADGAASDREVG